MSVFHNNALLGAAQPSGVTFDTTLIPKSAIFESGYLQSGGSGIGGSAGNRTRWTLAWWFQLNAISTNMTFFSANDGGNEMYIRMDDNSNQSLKFIDDNASLNVGTTAMQRDTAGWYHAIVSFDSNQSNEFNRVAIYINGEEQPLTAGTAAYPSSTGETFWNNSQNCVIGRRERTSDSNTQAYMAQVCFLNGDSVQNGDIGVTDFLDTFTFGTNGSQIIPKSNDDIKALATAAAGTSFFLDFAQGTDTKIDDSGSTVSGNMTNGGGLSAIFDGDTTKNNAQSAQGANTNANDSFVVVDHGSAKTVTRFVAYGSSDAEGLDGDSGGSTLTFTLAGSTDNFSSSNVTLANFTVSDPGAGGTVERTHANITQGSFRYHKLTLQTNTTNSGEKFGQLAQLEYYEGEQLGRDASDNANHFQAQSMGNTSINAQSISTPSKTYSRFNVLAHLDNESPGFKSNPGFTLSEGGRKNVINSSNQSVKTTIPFEMSGNRIIRTQFTFSTLGDGACGITHNRHTSGTYNTASGSGSSGPIAGKGEVTLVGNGALVIDGNFNNSYTSALSNGDVVDVIVNLNVGAVYFAVNGTLLGGATQSEISAGTTTNAALVSSFVRRTAGELFNFYATQTNPSSTTVNYNSGQEAFTHSYSSITGLQGLNTADLPAPDFQGKDYFENTTYQGDSAGSDDSSSSGQRVGDFVPFTDVYTVDHSVIFEHDSPRHFSRTIEAPSVTDADPSAVAKKGTWSVWFKTAFVDTDIVLFDTGTTATNRFSLQMDASGQIVFSHKGTTILKTDGNFKGDGAWHNVVLKVDTAQGTAADRAAMFVDGVEIAAADFEEDRRDNTNFSQNDEIGYMDENATQFVGSYNGSSANQWDGYLAEAVFLDDQFLDASSFGQLDTSTNQWVPKSVSGLTFGNCGFYLEFKSTLSLGTLIAQDAGTPIGNMTAGGGLAAAFDGDIEVYNNGAQSNATSGNIGKDFGSGVTKTVTGVVLKTLSNLGIDGGAADETMTLTVERSDNGTDFTQIFSQAGIVIGNNHVVTRRLGFSNTAAARYARVSVSHGGGAETHVSELEFYENGTATGADLGTDTSGNSNHFTMVNGLGESGLPDKNIWELVDQSNDAPTNNLPIWDGNDTVGSATPTLSAGNLKITGADNGGRVLTFPLSNGKWYWEIDVIDAGTAFYPGFATPAGIAFSSSTPWNNNAGSFLIAPVAGHWLGTNGSGTANLTSNYTAFIGDSDRMFFAFDADNKFAYVGEVGSGGTGSTLTYYSLGGSVSADPTSGSKGIGAAPFGLNNIADSQGGKINEFYHVAIFGDTSIAEWIFDSTKFNGTPPTGYQALTQDNLDATASKLTAWAWIKNRDATDNHVFLDRVRGVGKVLHSNRPSGTTNAAPAETTDAASQNTVQRFFQRGVQLGNDVEVNTVNEDYILWQWLMGESATTGTVLAADSISSGVPSLASTVIAADADHFSIISYQGNGSAGATIRHGLTSRPEMVWIKERDNANGWIVGSDVVGYTKILRLDQTDAETTDSGAFNNTAPDSSNMIITLGSNNGTNRDHGVSGEGEMICYAFRSVPGVCRIGQYTGNNQANGPYINLGFKPAWVITKPFSTTGEWMIIDNARSPTNPMVPRLFPSAASAEDEDGEQMDFLSDGFKLRKTGGHNGHGEKYLYMAMAEIGGNGTLPPIYGY